MGFVSQCLLKPYQLSVLTLWLAGIDALGDTETLTLATYFFLLLVGGILVSTTMAAYPKSEARLTKRVGLNETLLQNYASFKYYCGRERLKCCSPSCDRAAGSSGRKK